jgi:hypothetical protein
MEEPSSSHSAAAWSLFFAVLVILSVATMIIKSVVHPNEADMTDLQAMWWAVPEAIFTMLFMAELVVRFAVCNASGEQTHLEFMIKPLNICDLLAATPFVLERIGTGSGETSLTFLKIARLLRLSRLMRLARLRISTTPGRPEKKEKKSAKGNLFGAVAVVLTIIWGIYLKESPH